MRFHSFAFFYVPNPIVMADPMDEPFVPRQYVHCAAAMFAQARMTMDINVFVF